MPGGRQVRAHGQQAGPYALFKVDAARGGRPVQEANDGVRASQEVHAEGRRPCAPVHLSLCRSQILHHQPTAVACLSRAWHVPLCSVRMPRACPPCTEMCGLVCRRTSFSIRATRSCTGDTLLCSSLSASTGIRYASTTPFCRHFARADVQAASLQLPSRKMTHTTQKKTTPPTST
jgi:hypothetical protein